MTQALDPFILQIVTLKGPTAVVVFLVMLGYAAKMIPWIQNKYIPLINFAVGPILSVLLVAWPTTGSMEPGIRFPDVAAWFTVLQTGFLLACLAWITHAQVLRKWIDEKIPALTEGKSVDTKVEIEKHTDADGVEKKEQVTTTVTETKPT